MMKGFAVQKTLEDDFSSNPSASDHKASLSSILNPAKKKRSFPDPNAEVIALSPRSLVATNKFVCEVCGKGFQREQNLQLHRRGHNLPWKLKQRQNNEVLRRKVYICPEPSCSNHDPSRALGDLTGIKKHFFRKHGEKKWSCDKCSKKYAVLSDWKAHSKICGSKEYRCDCGTIFSRRDSFMTHKAFCEALTTQNYKRTMISASPFINNQLHLPQYPTAFQSNSFSAADHDLTTSEIIPQWLSSTSSLNDHSILYSSNICQYYNLKAISPLLPASPNISATALLQKAAEMGPTISRPSEIHSMSSGSTVFGVGSVPYFSGFGNSPFEEAMHMGGGLEMNPKREEGGRDETTRDFLGLRVPSSHEELFSISEI